MGRQSQKKAVRDNAGTSRPPTPPRGGQGLAIATAVAVVGVLALSWANWRAVRDVDARLGARLDRIETRLTQVSAKVDDLPKQAAEPAERRRPDPDRVYTIETAGAPSKGPADAAVTIAEFSDFQ